MGEWDPARSVDVLRTRRERTPARVALVDGDEHREWTYEQLDRFVDRVVAALSRTGVSPGDTVTTLLDTRPVSVVLPFATMRSGLTLAPLNVELDVETLGDQLNRLSPDLVLCDVDTESLVTEYVDGEVRLADASPTSSLDAIGVDPAPEAATIAPPADTTEHTLGADETALVAFTSGTTDRPKGVRLTPTNLLSSAAASAQRLGITPRDRWLSPLSTYHVGGIAPYVRSTLYGTAAIFQREFDADRTVGVLENAAANCVSFVPTMLARVLDAGWRPDPDFRFVLLGGGPASPKLIGRCHDLGLPVCPTYGATETASQVATATPGESIDHPGTVGRPLAGATIRIQGDGRECPPGTVGELVVSGPMVSPGYLDPSPDSPLDDEGFHTGDRGYRDEDGRIWIVGRADDVVVTGGENVQATTVADALREHAGVHDVAVVGVPDDEWGERVVALVVAETDVTATELRALCRERLPTYAVPKSIVFASKLPRTPSGTVDRDAVRDRFQ